MKLPPGKVTENYLRISANCTDVTDALIARRPGVVECSRRATNEAQPSQSPAVPGWVIHFGLDDRGISDFERHALDDDDTPDCV